MHDLLQLALLFLGTLGVGLLIAWVISGVFRRHPQGLGAALIVFAIATWTVHIYTGWVEFIAEQQGHDEVATVSDYMWVWWARSFENLTSEFWQLAAMVILTVFLIHKGSTESRDSSDRVEETINRIEHKLDQRG